jgi:hypothetical protein
MFWGQTSEVLETSKVLNVLGPNLEGFGNLQGFKCLGPNLEGFGNLRGFKCLGPNLGGFGNLRGF